MLIATVNSDVDPDLLDLYYGSWLDPDTYGEMWNRIRISIISHTDPHH